MRPREFNEIRLFPSWRLTTIFMATVGLFISYVLRTNLHIAKMCMKMNGTTDLRKGTYPWNDHDFGILFSALYYGQMVTQIAGGALSYHIGGHLVLPIGLIGASVVSILFPFATDYNYTMAFVIRVLLGMFIALVYTSKYQIVSSWVPGSERGKLVGLLETGIPLGIILSNPLVIELCVSKHEKAWAWSFYGPGICGVIWAIACFGLIRKDPSKQKAIGREEALYLRNSIPPKIAADVIPWKKLFLDRRLIGFYFSFALNRVCYTIFSTSIWMILNDERSRFSLRETNYPVMLYWTSFLVFVPIFGTISDYLINKGVLSRTMTRKLFVLIACVLPALMTAILAFNENRYWLKVVLLTLSYSAIAANAGGGMLLAPNDMAPDFSSTVWGIAYTFAAISTSCTNLAIGWIRNQHASIAWKVIMLSFTAVNVCAAIVFCVLVSGEAIKSLRPAQCEDGRVTNEIEMIH